MNIVKPNFYTRFQSCKSAKNFKFEAKDRAAILQQRYVDKFRVFYLRNLHRRWVKTAVKLKLFDDALNLALDRLNLTFSIENLQILCHIWQGWSGIYLKTWVNLLLKALELTFQIKFVSKFKPKNSCNKLKINKFTDRNFKFCRLNALV